MTPDRMGGRNDLKVHTTLVCIEMPNAAVAPALS
jgi:hypothetical protein